MAMQNPPHPGGIVRRQCLQPLDLTVTAAAKGLGVTRQALSDLVNEKAGISVEMAIPYEMEIKAGGGTNEVPVVLSLVGRRKRYRRRRSGVVCR